VQLYLADVPTLPVSSVINIMAIDDESGSKAVVRHSPKDCRKVVKQIPVEMCHFA
jgi:hypothetical protein